MKPITPLNPDAVNKYWCPYPFVKTWSYANYFSLNFWENQTFNGVQAVSCQIWEKKIDSISEVCSDPIAFGTKLFLSQ